MIALFCSKIYKQDCDGTRRGTILVSSFHHRCFLFVFWGSSPERNGNSMPDPRFEFHMRETAYSAEHKVPADFDFRKQGEEAIHDNYMHLGNIINSMSLTKQIDGVNANAYGDVFKDKLSRKERDAAKKKSGTELYEKAKSRRLVEGAEKEYDRQLKEFTKGIRKSKGVTVPDELEYDFEDACCLFRMKEPKTGVKIWKDYCGEPQERYRALDAMVESFVNQDFTFDLSKDSMIAAQSLKFIQLKRRADAFLSLISKNLGYWSAVDDITKASVMKKLSQADLLWDYYVKKEALITDEFYSSRMDSELSYINPISENAAERNRNCAVMSKIHAADEAYERLRHMEDQDREALVLEEMGKKITSQDKIETTAVPIGREVKSKAQGFEILDVFGLPLKIASFFMRDKRTADHGHVRYEKMRDEFDKKFPKYLYSIGEGRHGFYRGPKGNNDAPAVILDTLFDDPVKRFIADTLKDSTLKDGAGSDDEIATKKLFIDFTEAADRYAKIRGIVNADTTEMEMAFLDRMRDIEKEFGDNYTEDKTVSEISKRRAIAVKACMKKIRDTFSGNLKNVTVKGTYDNAVENSTAVIQSTTITENMDESNIEEIPLFTHYPNINDVKQSTIGDCYLVGAMTSFVKTSPQGVLDMFQDLGDGNVLVRLFEGYDNDDKRLDTSGKWLDARNTGNCTMRPVFVKLRKHYETGDGNANDCVWPQLIEKAYAAAGFNMKGEARVDEKGYLHDMEKELTSGYGFIALSHMTGKLQKRYRVAPMTDQENRRIKNSAGHLFTSDEFQHRLGAGVPKFLMETMMANTADNDTRIMDTEYLEIMFPIHLKTVCIEYGSKLLQIKKQFMRKGFGKESYVPVISRIADDIGLKLADDWADQGSSQLDMMGTGQVKSEFQLDQDDQRWDTLFDIEHIYLQYMGKLKENLDHISKGEDVTFDTVKGLDTSFFSDDNVNELLDSIIKLSRTGDNEDLAPRIAGINKTIDAMLSFGNDEDVKQKAIDEHKTKYDAFWTDHESAEKARTFAKKMNFGNHDIIRENLLDFVITLKDAIDKGGSVEISINHFVSAVDLKVHNNQWFVLIKDPFNVYNMAYQRDKNGVSIGHEESFLDVLNLEGHRYKRHLDDKGDINRSLMGGFRGLSWWKLDDLGKKMKDYTPVLPGDIKHTV